MATQGVSFEVSYYDFNYSVTDYRHRVVFRGYAIEFRKEKKINFSRKYLSKILFKVETICCSLIPKMLCGLSTTII